MMTSRERVIRAIEFKGIDRIPIMHAVLPAAWYKYGEELANILSRYPKDIVSSLDKMDVSRRPASAGYKYSEDLSKKWTFEDDFIYLEPRSFQYGTPGEAGDSTDEWGCTWRKIDPGIVGQVIKSPLEDWDNLDSYRFPDALAYWRFNIPEIERTIEYAQRKGKYIIAYSGNLFELLQWIRDYVPLMMDIMEDRERVRFLIEKIVDYNLKTLGFWLRYPVDGILFQDDWGTQRQLIINPKIWRELFKPYYKELFEAVHRAGHHVHFHTDGYTIDIIPDLIEIGVDVLNPQFSAMNLDALAKIVAGKICIRSDIDRQYILTKALPEEVELYVKRVIDLFGSKEGGFIGMGEINSDSKLENVEAMYEAFEKYGRYN
ncbi:MAG: uroporphyrinogen decarboxylase family protein [bacterium]